MPERPKRPRQLDRSLIHTAAKLHYLGGASQLEVARRLQVSTATVSRLLARARAEGIVRIQVADLDEADATGDTLCRALGLRSVRVLESDRHGALASQVAALLSEAALRPGAVVAIGWGRTVQGVIEAGLPKIPECIVVPTTGGMYETAAHFQINEFVRSAAEQMEGRPCFLHVPALPSPSLRAMLDQDPEAAKVFAAWSRVDVAVTGIGAYRPGDEAPKVRFDGDEADRVVGDVVRHYFDAEGRAVAWRGQENLMAIGRTQLSRVPLSIGVAAGIDKVAAILGAARSGMINALVTEANVARAILDTVEQAG